MKEFNFAEHLLLRAPAGNWRDYHVHEQFFLEDKVFHSAVYIASKLFFDCLQQKGFRYANLSEKEKLTLKKYINRYCFRPIPFGLFAGISLVRWGERSHIDLPDIGSADIKLAPDQGWIAAVCEDLREKNRYAHSSYITNPTLYKLGDEYRFVHTELDTDGKTRRFLLQSAEYSPILQELAQYSRVPRSSQELIGHIAKLADCSTAIAADYYLFLKSEQFLVDFYRRTISGKDPIEYLLDVTPVFNSQIPIVNTLRRLTKRLKTVSSLQPAFFQTLNRELNEVISGTADSPGRNNLYVILNRSLPDATIAAENQDKIHDAIFALRALAHYEPNPAMEQFIKGFQKDFEGQTLDLLYALDPDVGVGYHRDENSPNSLMETLQFGSAEGPDNDVNWTDTHSLILEKWHSADFRREGIIELEENDLQAIAATKQTAAPFGLSVIFRIWNRKIYVESAGGVNPVALMGRFTINDEAITDASRKMAREIEIANPHLIFAELLHLAGTHTDNINRRETIWSYEIPITAASTLPDAQRIPLADLRLKIDQGSVILYSEKHQKQVIPRLSSAYNHTIDKLPLFRFLVDICSQNAQPSLGLDLRHLFPGLSFYPRVSYKQAVLSLATWILTEKQIQAISLAGASAENSAHGVSLAAIGLPRIFSMAEGDQQLVFYRDVPEDRRFFADCIRLKKEVVIREFLLEGENAMVTKGDAKPSFVQQFNVSMLPINPLPQVEIAVNNTKPKQQLRRFMAGSEWLYLKIYSARSSSSKLLLKIVPLLRRRYNGHLIQCWFFVRYEDHAPHIRLRIKMDPLDISLLLIALKKVLQNSVSEHIIREYQIDVYTRELERYQAGGMALSEQFFWASSELVIRYLERNEKAANLQAHDLAFRTTLDVIKSFSPNLPDQLQFAETCYQQYLSEFNDKRLKVEMDQKYRAMAADIGNALNNENFYRGNGLFQPGQNFKRTLKELANSVPAEDPHTEKFVQSIIHMHLNRIFVNEPRKQELIIYYFIYKYLNSAAARAKKQLKIKRLDQF